MTSARRVVFISQIFPPEKGGNASRIHDMTTNLQDSEWDISVLSPPPSYPPGEFDRSWRRVETESVDGVTVHRLWTWQPTVEDPGMVRRLPYYLLFGIHAILWLLWNVRQYDAVVTSTPPISTGAPGLLAAGLGKTWVVDVRDLWIDASISLGYLEKNSLIERVSRRFQRLVLHSSDRITVTTDRLGKSLRQAYGESLVTKTVIIPNGVDVSRFQPKDDLVSGADISSDPDSDQDELSTDVAKDQALSARDAKADGRGRPIIIYTGNLGSAQDLESCIRAMTHLSHDAVLRLVGSGDMESNLRELTDELGLQDRVEFYGVVPRKEVPRLLSEATIGIAPLRDTEELSYAMPTKVYEYMASGLPTLVTGRGEIKRFIEESGGGVQTENDPQRIAEGLDELLADGQFRRELAKNGHEHVSEKYDRREIAEQLGDELSSLVGGRP